MVADLSALCFESLDFDGPWYKKYFFMASKHGFLTDTVREEFADEQITRMEIAEVIDRIIWADGLIEVDDSELAELTDFYGDKEHSTFDVSQLPDRAKLDMKYSIKEELPFSDMKDMDEEQRSVLFSNIELGIITGYEDGTFRPDNKVTRAEVATMIQRFFAKYGTYIYR